MTEESGNGKYLLALLLTTLVAGCFVMIVKSDYRIDDISRTNEEYYPHIQVEESRESKP